MDWRWRIGFLNGFGEAMWQELGEKMRRITRFLPMPNGQSVIIKAVPCVSGTDPEPQFDIASLVIASVEPNDKLCQDVQRAWEPSNIIPVNGSQPHPRFKS